MQSFAEASNLTGQDKYLKAIQHLEKASVFAKMIKNEDVKFAVCSELEACKECFDKDFQTKDYAHMAEKADAIQENIGEVLADCDQETLMTGIVSCIEEMHEQFQE
jgi:hypothetical protein